jgi:hypothetical protein
MDDDDPAKTMSNDAPTRQETIDDGLDDLLNEVWHVETQANNPRTREFLEAGRALLHTGLTRDAGEPTSAKGGRSRAPFNELLAWVSRRRVVAEAGKKYGENEGKPTESSFRYRWRDQTGYLRDLVVYALRPRMARPEETEDAERVLFRSGLPLDEAIQKICYDEVRNLNCDKAFRLQMVFQSVLSHDARVADTLRRIDQTNVDAWKKFYSDALDRLGINLRPDVKLDDLAYALQAAAEGVVLRSLLPATINCPPAALALDHKNQTSRPLALIAMALLVAFAESDDGKELRQVVRELSSGKSAGRRAGQASG